MLTVHLVRHGQSTWNARGRLQGHTAHVRLSARGRREAAGAAAALAARPVTAVLSSDLRRAWETAAVIAAVHGLPVRPETALREQGHGVFEGGPAAVHGALLARADPDWAPPGGESARRVHARVATLLTSLPPDGEVVLVSHGETIRAALAVFGGVGADAMPAGRPANGAIVTASRDRPGGRWTLDRVDHGPGVWSSSR